MTSRLSKQVLLRLTFSIFFFFDKKPTLLFMPLKITYQRLDMRSHNCYQKLNKLNNQPQYTFPAEDAILLNILQGPRNYNIFSYLL